MPESAIVTVRYTDDDGTTYADSYPIGLKDVGITPLPSTGKESVTKDASHRDFLHLGQALAHHLGELRR